jgi:hypothetical protein
MRGASVDDPEIYVSMGEAPLFNASSSRFLCSSSTTFFVASFFSLFSIDVVIVVAFASIVYLSSTTALASTVALASTSSSFCFCSTMSSFFFYTFSFILRCLVEAASSTYLCFLWSTSLTCF